MGRSWAVLGFVVLFLVAVCCSWLLLGAPAVSDRPPGVILEPFGEPESMIFETIFSAHRGGCFWTCFSCSLSCAGALKFVLFAIGATRAPKQINRNENVVS